MEQHKSIQQNIHSQVQSVCADTSLSDQQKREKIRDIRKAGHQQMEALLTPEQRSQLESCRASQPHHGGGQGGPHAGGGPCKRRRIREGQTGGRTIQIG
jgi:Spy/CpxP family protein refolding chaperone